MAKKRTKRFHIATQTGYVDDSFATKGAARKALTEIVRDDARACRRRYRRCSVVGSAQKDDVEIKIGGRQGYHLWQRYVINED